MKMFYTMEEAAAKLGIQPDGLKTLVEENKLREFRDGARSMYKADQVEKLAENLNPQVVAQINERAKVEALLIAHLASLLKKGTFDMGDETLTIEEFEYDKRGRNGRPELKVRVRSTATDFWINLLEK